MTESYGAVQVLFNYFLIGIFHVKVGQRREERNRGKPDGTF